MYSEVGDCIITTCTIENNPQLLPRFTNQHYVNEPKVNSFWSKIKPNKFKISPINLVLVKMRHDGPRKS